MKTFEWEWSCTDPAIVIEYDFTPGDPGVTHFEDHSGEPPSPPYVDITTFKFQGVDITDLMEMLMDQSLADEIEAEIIEWEEDPDRKFFD